MSYPNTKSIHMGVERADLTEMEGKVLESIPPPVVSSASQAVPTTTRRSFLGEGSSGPIPVVGSNSSGGSGSGRIPSRPITIAASVGALGMMGGRYALNDPISAADDSGAEADQDFNGDDEKYRRLKMKYLTSLKVVRPTGQTERSMMVSQSVPDTKFNLSSLRSQPIAIPEKTRRVDDFFYKSPADDAMDAQDELCQFVLEL
jgi:hypothetical protein